MRLALIIVDHGSRRQESNRMLQELCHRFARRFARRYPIVEPAHMELAEPTIAQAYDRCVDRGAERIVVFPFFLGPGKHWSEDIPRLVSRAASRHPATQYYITGAIGIDDVILDLIDRRIRKSLRARCVRSR